MVCILCNAELNVLRCVQCQCLHHIYPCAYVSYNWPFIRRRHRLRRRKKSTYDQFALADGTHTYSYRSCRLLYCIFFFHFLFIPCLSSIKQIYMFKWSTYFKWRIIAYNRLKRPIHLEIIIKLPMWQCLNQHTPLKAHQVFESPLQP